MIFFAYLLNILLWVFAYTCTYRSKYKKRTKTSAFSASHHTGSSAINSQERKPRERSDLGKALLGLSYGRNHHKSKQKPHLFIYDLHGQEVSVVRKRIKL